MNDLGIKIHPVNFTGVYTSPDEGPFSREEYGDHRDDGSPVVNGATQKMIEAVKLFSNDKISVVDFGGGGGKMYSTLKQETDKQLDYSIIELPGVKKDLGYEVSYYSSFDEIDKDVDIVYSDATLHLTRYPAADIIRNICKLNPSFIVLNRSILFFHSNSNSDIRDKSFYTWVPAQKNYYNIIELTEYENIFQAEGYDLMCRTFTQRLDNSPPRQLFQIEGRVINDPVVTYFDHVFKKKEPPSLYLDNLQEK